MKVSTFSAQALLYLLVLLVPIYASLGLLGNDASKLYVACACIAGIIPLAGLLSSRKVDLFSPLGFIAFAVLFGTTATAFWLSSANTPRTTFMMFSQQFEDVLATLPLVLLGLLAVTLGYVATFRGGKVKSIDLGIVPGRVHPTLYALLLISVIGAVLFVQRFGIDLSDLSQESAKRTAAYVSESGDVVYGTGFEIFLARCSNVGAVLAWCLIIARRKVGIQLLLLALVFSAIVVFVGFVSSSRTNIIYTAASVVVFAAYYRAINYRYVLALGVLLLSIAILLGQLRANDIGASDQYANPIDFVMGSGNGFDMVRSTAIIDRVPERHDFLYGSSLLSLLTTPIPRALWPDKPSSSLGPWVKSELFGLPTRNNGWPPGMVAEAYINFGTLGIPLVLFIFGAFLKMIYRAAVPYLGSSPVVTMAYAICITRISYNCFSLNFAQGVIQTLQYALPFVVVSLFLSRLDKSQVDLARPGQQTA